jgi:hypothetical protein
MKKVKTFLKKCWESAAFRNLSNLIVSVALSTLLTKNGVPPQDATAIGQAAGTVITGQ